MSEKTEEPTPRRLRKAREEGDSGASVFAAQSIAFVAAVALVPAAARALVTRVTVDLGQAIDRAARPDARGAALAWDVGGVAAEVLALTLPIVIAAAVVSAAAQVVQTGGVVAGKRLAPRLDRLDLVEGVRKLVSGVRLFAVARALLGAAVVAWLAFRALDAHLVDFDHLPGRLSWTFAALGEIAHGLARDAAVAGVAIGALDLLIVRRAWMRRLRMTKDEVRREHKESEGDPHVKAARRRAHQEVLAQATIAGVKDATVLVVDPTHLATALRYDGQAEAPVVIARGEGDLAQRMIRAAEQYGVPVVRDVPLARALAELAIGDAIPEALYEAVAEILRDAWEAEGR